MKLPGRSLLLGLWLTVAAALPARANTVDELVQAAVRDNPGQVQHLLQSGVDPNALDSKGRLALVTALQEASPRAAQALLDSGRVDLRRRNQAGETALMMAALKGDYDWCVKLIELGAEIDHAGWTPLHYAATGGDERILSLLLSKGAKVEALSPNDTTPLMMAAGYGSEAAAQLLLKAGAVPERRNARGLDAADFARLQGREALAKAFEDLKRRRAARQR